VRLQRDNFSLTGFVVCFLKIKDGRVARHAKTTTLSMLPRQVYTQRQAG